MSLPSWEQGFCAPTWRGDLSAKLVSGCDTGFQGVLPLVPHENWQEAARTCLALCAGCTRCRYVSLSLSPPACSWYADCDLASLRKEPAGFLSSPANVSTTFCSEAGCLPRMRRHAPHRDLLLKAKKKHALGRSRTERVDTSPKAVTAAGEDATARKGAAMAMVVVAGWWWWPRGSGNATTMGIAAWVLLFMVCSASMLLVNKIVTRVSTSRFKP
jgi:hypothetical protein